jgi:hypothetical protein
VADIAELRRLAARVGATASVGNETFNTQGARLKVVRPPPPQRASLASLAPPVAPALPAPEIVLPPAEAVPAAAGADMTAVIERLGQTIVDAMRPMARLPELMQAEALDLDFRAPAGIKVALEKDPALGLLQGVVVSSGGKKVRFQVSRDEDTHQLSRMEGAGIVFNFEQNKNRELTRVAVTTAPALT